MEMAGRPSFHAASTHCGRPTFGCRRQLLSVADARSGYSAKHPQSTRHPSDRTDGCRSPLDGALDWLGSRPELGTTALVGLPRLLIHAASGA